LKCCCSSSSSSMLLFILVIASINVGSMAVLKKFQYLYSWEEKNLCPNLPHSKIAPPSPTHVNAGVNILLRKAWFFLDPISDDTKFFPKMFLQHWFARFSWADLCKNVWLTVVIICSGWMDVCTYAPHLKLKMFKSMISKVFYFNFQTWH
jgi:hypothetical protein